MELDGLALPGEVQLGFYIWEMHSKKSSSWATLFGLDLELDFIVEIQ